MKEADFEVLICLKSLDSKLFPTMIRYVETNIKPKGITLITHRESIAQYKQSYPHICFIDEDCVYPKLTFGAVQEKLSSLGCALNRAGWYLQQFLKMAYSAHQHSAASSSGGGGALSHLGRGLYPFKRFKLF
ncbi:hypothetical protein OQH61_04275 [Helicobacter sp. MIT 21-1697]|uniref:hypothetical protein n=1 Tax=Helicobacter sp. MIT 21-1697 TaxID=2993733 RepID=UPI00224ABFF7|nr:hypothetical protein [Helicobacter sp. MIT 21-1697]MCX2716948.1 hypothetical protein [Helicobacter sp. MIT 21-1697]